MAAPARTFSAFHASRALQNRSAGTRALNHFGGCRVRRQPAGHRISGSPAGVKMAAVRALGDRHWRRLPSLRSIAGATKSLNEKSMPEQPQPRPLRVDIVSDVVCPWCIIGYLQLQKALDSMPGQFDVSLRWHPFELNPQMPAGGEDLRGHLARKYGASAEQGRAVRSRLTALGKSLGFTFDYFDAMRIVNTFKAHQLLQWAAEQGRQTDLKLALFEAFFSRREDVSDLDLLAAVADRVGLSPTEAVAVLATGRYAVAVREEQQAWLDREVHAVPHFLFNERYVVPGAQEAETFVRFLTRIRDRGLA